MPPIQKRPRAALLRAEADSLTIGEIKPAAEEAMLRGDFVRTCRDPVSCAGVLADDRRCPDTPQWLGRPDRHGLEVSRPIAREAVEGRARVDDRCGDFNASVSRFLAKAGVDTLGASAGACLALPAPLSRPRSMAPTECEGLRDRVPLTFQHRQEASL